MNEPIIIVGAGLAGLNCAVRLNQLAYPVLVLEGSDGIGGRVHSDHVDGFTLDRGFQIYLSAYPEGQKVLDLEALNLQPFLKGAKIWSGGRFHRLTDPRNEPLNTLSALTSPIGTFRDKWKLLWFHREMMRDTQLSDHELTLDLLRWKGKFSEQMIDRFFRPFFGGVFLEKQLVTSSHFFRFVYRMFAIGSAGVPAKGMQEIPNQLAKKLPVESIQLNSPVASIDRNQVMLADGQKISARAVVVATERDIADQLVHVESVPSVWNATTTLYYAAERSPLGEAILALDGENQGPVNHLAVMSDAAPEYAPKGKSLIAANVVGTTTVALEQLDVQVRSQMTSWFGAEVQNWKLLKAYVIPKALPRLPFGSAGSERLKPGLYRCGDYLESPSINGALLSGFRCAQAVAEDVNAKRI
jgi:phytoene dehydrogenase-like protein